VVTLRKVRRLSYERLPARKKPSRSAATATDSAAFESAATALRVELQVVSENNVNVRGVIFQMDAEARELVFPADN
jgi:hypothetical protein